MKYKYGIYGYFDENGECLYIGIDSHIDEDRRHKEHLKPAKGLVQGINYWLQNSKNWTYKRLWEADFPNFLDKDDCKHIIHNAEMRMIDKFEPSLNDKGTSN